MTIQLALTRQVLYIRNLYKLITIIYMYHMELHQPFLLMHLWNISWILSRDCFYIQWRVWYYIYIIQS